MQKGYLIMQTRLNANFSLEKLANLCSMSCSNLYNIETNKTKKPKLETLFSLSNHLSLDFKELAISYGYSFTELTYKLTITRLEAGLSITNLAILCEIDFYHLTHILNGKKKPHLNTLYILAKNLNLEFKDLMLLSGYPFTELAYQVIVARLDANLSLEDFSTLSGISQTQLYRIENSKVKKPSEKTLISLSRYTALSLEDLKQLCA